MSKFESIVDSLLESNFRLGTESDRWLPKSPDRRHTGNSKLRPEDYLVFDCNVEIVDGKSVYGGVPDVVGKRLVKIAIRDNRDKPNLSYRNVMVLLFSDRTKYVRNHVELPVSMSEMFSKVQNILSHKTATVSYAYQNIWLDTESSPPKSLL